MVPEFMLIISRSPLARFPPEAPEPGKGFEGKGTKTFFGTSKKGLSTETSKNVPRIVAVVVFKAFDCEMLAFVPPPTTFFKACNARPRNLKSPMRSVERCASS